MRKVQDKGLNNQTELLGVSLCVCVCVMIYAEREREREKERERERDSMVVVRHAQALRNTITTFSVPRSSKT